MHRFSTPQHDLPRHYPISIGRMTRYARNAAPSHQSVTIASAERLPAACAMHSNNLEIMQNFQRMLLVTMGDWRQRTDA